MEKFVEDFQKDFRVFVDYLELIPGKVKEAEPMAFKSTFSLSGSEQVALSKNQYVKDYR
ncbi:MAG TPA: hypothetical protein VMD05_01395 [Candidatus Nanoarchaeia archaeon]|nr:hypothetical protein [Candidatus Nanoarchaeia archaeon]